MDKFFTVTKSLNFKCFFISSVIKLFKIFVITWNCIPQTFLWIKFVKKVINAGTMAIDVLKEAKKSASTSLTFTFYEKIKCPKNKNNKNIQIFGIL